MVHDIVGAVEQAAALYIQGTKGNEIRDDDDEFMHAEPHRPHVAREATYCDIDGSGDEDDGQKDTGDRAHPPRTGKKRQLSEVDENLAENEDDQPKNLTPSRKKSSTETTQENRRGRSSNV